MRKRRQKLREKNPNMWLLVVGIHITPDIQIPKNVIPSNFDAQECNYSYIWFHW